jgi:hypothetical protein
VGTTCRRTCGPRGCCSTTRARSWRCTGRTSRPGPDGGSHEQGRLGVRRSLVAGLPREPDTRGDPPLGLAARQPGGHPPRHARLVARRRVGTTLQDEFVRSWLEGAPRGPDAANGLLTPLPNADERRWTERLLDTVVYAVECTRQTALALLWNRRSTTNVWSGTLAAAAEPCLSNCLTTTPETSSQLWTRSVVQVHLGPHLRIPLPPGPTLQSQADRRSVWRCFGGPRVCRGSGCATGTTL